MRSRPRRCGPGRRLSFSRSECAWRTRSSWPAWPRKGWLPSTKPWTTDRRALIFAARRAGPRGRWRARAAAAREELDAITHAEERIGMLEKEEARLLKELGTIGSRLSEARRAAG